MTPDQQVDLAIIAQLNQDEALVRDLISPLSAIGWGGDLAVLDNTVALAVIRLALAKVEAHPIEWGTGKETEPPGKDAAVDGSAVNKPGAGEQLARPSATDGGGEKMHHQASKTPRSTRLTECLLGLLCFVIFLITLGPAEIDDPT